MRFAIVFGMSICLFASPATAAFTDFSDYGGSNFFAIDETFSSDRLQFKAVEMLPRHFFNPTWVIFEELIPGPGVEFLLPPNVHEVSMRFRDGAGIAIAINGVEPISYPGIAGFGFLDGTTLGGVSIATLLNEDRMGYQDGLLTLCGPINSLMIAGLELGIDDITVRVPEPSTLSLVLLAAGVFSS